MFPVEQKKTHFFSLLLSKLVFYFRPKQKQGPVLNQLNAMSEKNASAKGGSKRR